MIVLRLNMTSSSNKDIGTSNNDFTMSDDKTIINLDDFIKDLFQNVKTVTQASHSLPTGHEFEFYSSFSKMKNILDFEGNRLLYNIQNFMKFYNLKGNLLSKSESVSVEDKFDILEDLNDQILERVGTYLDDAAGLKNENNSVVVSVVSSPHISGCWNKSKTESSSPTTTKLLSARNIVRPQLNFKDKVDNKNRPFVPLISEKPNASLSLEESLKLKTYDEDGNLFYKTPHPYQYELDHLKYPEWQLNVVDIKKPLTLEDTNFLYIDEELQIIKMLTILETADKIAIDLEAHSFRSYLGITCLMQISTSNTDIIIDTLKLRSNLQPLNKVFTNPNVIKIFHGADFDIEWLQRDLGLYVVNMFDTFQAAKMLQLPRYSLAFLLKHYCDIEANKQYQLADWRMRPLPNELIKYAREDSHFLIFIYETMKRELIERGNENKNLLLSVLDKSRVVCNKTFEKTEFTENSFKSLYIKSTKNFNNQQLTALKSLFSWRDGIARIEDESVGYVLPNHMLLQIAELLPKEPEGILACCNPMPPLVRQNLMELFQIILSARNIEKDHVKCLHQNIQDHPKYQEENFLVNNPHDVTNIKGLSDSIKTPFSIAEPTKKVSKFLFEKLSSVEYSTKVLEVKQFFVNPFFMYTAKSVLNSVQSSGNIENNFLSWTLKKPDISNIDNNNSEEEIETTNKCKNDPILPNDVIPLKYQASKGKLKLNAKKKKTEKNLTKESPIVKKKKLTYDDVEKANLPDIDYSKSIKKNVEEKKSTDFNPNEIKSSNIESKKKPRTFKSLKGFKGKKSLTYTK